MKKQDPPRAKTKPGPNAFSSTRGVVFQGAFSEIEYVHFLLSVTQLVSGLLRSAKGPREIFETQIFWIDANSERFNLKRNDVVFFFLFSENELETRGSAFLGLYS